MKTIKFNTYCKKLDKLTKELSADIDLLTEHSEQFMQENCQTVKDARARLEALYSLRRLSRRINKLTEDIETA